MFLTSHACLVGPGLGSCELLTAAVICSSQRSATGGGRNLADFMLHFHWRRSAVISTLIMAKKELRMSEMLLLVCFTEDWIVAHGRSGAFCMKQGTKEVWTSKQIRVP